MDSKGITPSKAKVRPGTYDPSPSKETFMPGGSNQYKTNVNMNKYMLPKKQGR